MLTPQEERELENIAKESEKQPSFHELIETKNRQDRKDWITDIVNIGVAKPMPPNDGISPTVWQMSEYLNNSSIDSTPYQHALERAIQEYTDHDDQEELIAALSLLGIQQKIDISDDLLQLLNQGITNSRLLTLIANNTIPENEREKIKILIDEAVHNSNTDFKIAALRFCYKQYDTTAFVRLFDEILQTDSTMSPSDIARFADIIEEINRHVEDFKQQHADQIIERKKYTTRNEINKATTRE